MLAVRWHGRGDVRVEEVRPPASPGPGEVQLRVRWCGICGTDLEEWLSGPVFIPAAAPHPVTGARAPLVLGHEFAGVVVAAGAGVTGPRAVPPGEAGALEADVAVECAGSADAIHTALQALRPGGRAVLLSIVTQPAPVAPMDLIRGEKSLIGSLSHVWDQDFREALRLL